QDEAGLCAAYIDVEITMYAAAADGDGYGPELTAEGFLRRQKTLVADNNTVVNPSTGEILLIRTPVQSTDEWLAAANAIPGPAMLQGEFFGLLRSYSPIDIEGLIVTHITQADGMGRFA
ncbi:hypothetical protein, partial [Hymenobacter terricola]|uniref:hypothetical protein n=1 Tax=Hymenobacter terricola TaxID=2819236 RepID=UPI001CF2F9AF